MKPTAQLRTATEAAHLELEQTAFGEALASGALTRLQYVDYLRATAVIVGTVASGVGSGGSPELRAAAGGLERWPARLHADLSALLSFTTPMNFAVNRAALAAARRLRERPEAPYLLGAIYVLRGSHRGSLRVAPAVQRALGTTDSAGTSYLLATRDDPPTAWPEFVEQLDRQLASAPDLELAVEGARQLFGAFSRIFHGLGTQGEARFVVTSLNAEAGSHEVPQDARILELSIEAADRAADAFPYLDLRFGGRGRRFARSDGAWLATLCELPLEVASKQAWWLARVLSARGIPSLCLETHLRALGEALRTGSYVAGGRVEIFSALADELEQHRAANLPDGVRSLGEVGEIGALGQRAAELLASAVADQRAGLAACADDIRVWAEGEPKLSASDRAAIVAALGAAR